MLTIKKVDFNTIPISRCGKFSTKNLEVISEFLNGGYDAAEITDNADASRDAQKIVNSMNQSIKRFGHSSTLIAITRSNKAYLVRKELLG